MPVACLPHFLLFFVWLPISASRVWLRFSCSKSFWIRSSGPEALDSRLQNPVTYQRPRIRNTGLNEVFKPYFLCCVSVAFSRLSQNACCLPGLWDCCSFSIAAYFDKITASEAWLSSCSFDKWPTATASCLFYLPVTCRLSACCLLFIALGLSCWMMAMYCPYCLSVCSGAWCPSVSPYCQRPEEISGKCSLIKLKFQKQNDLPSFWQNVFAHATKLAR